jgi:hypothetical protein
LLDWTLALKHGGRWSGTKEPRRHRPAKQMKVDVTWTPGSRTRRVVLPYKGSLLNVAVWRHLVGVFLQRCKHTNCLARFLPSVAQGDRQQHRAGLYRQRPHRAAAQALVVERSLAGPPAPPPGPRLRTTRARLRLDGGGVFAPADHLAECGRLASSLSPQPTAALVMPQLRCHPLVPHEVIASRRGATRVNRHCCIACG